ncbi:larval/pupal cuticle protein H1C-like [Bacillus rossius redtenbacheri]|uniref:larval/pupal cuticle protein H1C-like n=1 Tax=Bacillus rossius redtenbacheri TaxID=93214 RepID=UPI002FDEE60D
MAFKLFVLAAVLAVANAGYLGAPAVATYGAYAAPAVAAYGAYAAPAVSYGVPAVGASHQSTVRTLDGNSAISHYSKAVDSPFSSVRKVDTRVSNDAQALAYAPAVAAYAAPAVAAYHGAYAAPAVAAYHGAYAAPAVAAYHGVGYSAAPVVSHATFSGYGVHYGY